MDRETQTPSSHDRENVLAGQLMDRTQALADSGATSSFPPHYDLTEGPTRASVWIRLLNYLLERSEVDRLRDEQIRRRSFAGFYYFIKWTIRSLFLMAFSVAGNIGGKELGCMITSHDSCSSPWWSLIDSAPHMISALMGLMVGLLLGQSIGRWLWDHMMETIQRTLRFLERKADRTKCLLILSSICIFLVFEATWIFLGLTLFPETFMQVLFGLSGVLLTLLFVIASYYKLSPCITGQRSPLSPPVAMVTHPPPLELQLH